MKNIALYTILSFEKNTTINLYDSSEQIFHRLGNHGNSGFLLSALLIICIFTFSFFSYCIAGRQNKLSCKDYFFWTIKAFNLYAFKKSGRQAIERWNNVVRLSDIIPWKTYLYEYHALCSRIFNIALFILSLLDC